MKRGDVILACAELLVTLEHTFKLKMSEAPLAENFLPITCSNVTEWPTKVLYPRVVLFKVKKVDVNWTIDSAYVHWMACFTDVIKITEEVD